MTTIFIRCVTNATRSGNAFLFSIERLERYEFDLHEYLRASQSLGCGTSSLGSVKYANIIAIHRLKCRRQKGVQEGLKEGKNKETTREATSSLRSLWGVRISRQS